MPTRRRAPPIHRHIACRKRRCWPAATRLPLPGEVTHRRHRLSGLNKQSRRARQCVRVQADATVNSKNRATMLVNLDRFEGGRSKGGGMAQNGGVSRPRGMRCYMCWSHTLASLSLVLA